MTSVKCAVEGDLDQAVLARLLALSGHDIETTYGLRGKEFIRERIDGYNAAARRQVWVVLVDLDHEEECALALRTAWLAQESAGMNLRVAVREIETWLIADREAVAAFLRVKMSDIPRDPESLDDPKLTMVQIASKSRSREIREDMVPRLGSGRAEGPAYNSRLVEFAQSTWNPARAAKSSRSLEKMLLRLASLHEP